MPNKNKKNINWLSIPIAILALCLSSWIFYKDYLKPFNLSARASGRVVIAKNPFSENLKQDCLLVSLIFSNSGARQGVVEDIAICIRYENKNIILGSLAVNKDRTLNLQKELPPPQMETFLSFNLKKYESDVKEIMFVPIETEESFSFKKCQYHADIWISSDNNWKKYESFEFSITNEDISALALTPVEFFDDGSYYIKWIYRDKALASQEKQILKLKELIQK